MKSIWIYEGGGSNPHIIAAIDTDRYSDHDSRAMYAVISKKVNNVSTLEVRIPTNCEASKAITNTSDLVLYDTDGNLQEFHITDIEDMEEYSVIRYIYAEQSLGELINDMIQAGTAMPTTTNPKDYLDYILSFTRWSAGTVDSGIHNSKWEEDLVGRNCLEALQMFIDKYNCEFEVRYETDNKNKITGRYIDVKKTTGHNYGKRFEDDKDILGLKRKMELDSVKTAIYPRIARNVSNEDGSSHTEYIDISEVTWSVAAGDPVDKPKGQAILVNPQADSMYKRYNTKTGKLMDRIMYAEWTEETAKDAEDLISQAWSILKANSALVPTVELNATDLFRLSGDDPDYWHEQVALGDTCIVISKSFEPELRLETRVMEMEEDLLNPINNSYVFGSYRKTLATSNIEQQKSIEEKLNELQNKLQGVTIPEPKPQYQSGRVYYEDIKGQIQNEFMQSGGYVMAEDADGFWVFDAPVASTYALRSATANYPTKATILKGGSLAIAEYDAVRAEWVVGTFINGMSINADYINTGHLNADVIEVGSITADHLSLAAIEYIKTGMATEEELQGVIANISAIQKDYVTSQALQQAIDGVTGGTLTLSQVKAIEDTQRQLKAEYNSVYKQASLVYANEYLPAGSTEKVALGEKITAYTSAYNTYNDQITSMIADQNITDDEYNTYKANASAYDTALTNLFEAIENANNARLANVYAQARQGLVTTAQLEVNNKSVIASAKQGMVSTADMTDAINFATEDLVSKGEMNTAIAEATNNLASTTDLTNQVASVKIESIKQTYNAIKVEYSNNKKQADTLYANTYLSGTAKTNLNSAISDYSSKFTALTTAYNDIVNTGTFTESQANVWSTAISNLNTGTTTLAQRMQEANNAINTAITNAANSYADGIKNDVTQDINGVSTAVDTLRTDVTTTIKDGIIEEAEAIAIQSNIAILNSEKADVDKEYSTLYANSNLTGTPKSNLKSKKDAYNTAHTNLINAINTAIADSKVTEEESSDIGSKFTAYNTALANYRDAVVVATDAIAANKINTATKDFVTATTMSNAIDNAVSELPSVTDVESAKNNAIIAANIETIKQTFKSITNEYNSNHKQADTIYKDSYLADTAKTNLSNAINNYNAKYNAVKTAHDDIVNKATLTTDQLNAWNTAITNLQSATTTLAQRMQEAQTYINTAIYNASKNYTDQAIPDALTGYAKTSYVDQAKADAIADAKNGMVSTSQLEVNNTEILMKTASMGQYNLLRNTDYRAGTEHWNSWGTGNGIKVKIGTSADYANCMSGERNLGITTDSSITSLDHSVGFKQYVELTGNVTYTLSYWVNCVKCRCVVNIETNDTIGGESTSILATKNYTNINGNQKRETWKYDSISFTVPELATVYDKKVISVVFYIDIVSKAQARAWLVKPMLGTGINAQAWTAHPDEIHVGVVSVTEERGIMVEHSDSNTYSTLDATGLKIWEYRNDTPIASFGDGNTAYIDTVSTKKLIAENVTPTITVNDDHAYYFSNTGSGDYSGRDSQNCIAGFTGAMAKMCDDFGIDRTHTRGNFMMQGNGSINFFCHGSVHDEDFYLENIYGGASIIIGFVRDITVSGSFNLINIQCPFRIFGNRGDNSVNEGAIFKRGARDGIYIKHCSRVEIDGLRFTSNQNSNNSGIAIVDGSNAYVRYCDIDKFKWGIFVARQSTAYIANNRGTSGFCGCYAPDTATIIYRGSIPAGHTNHDVPHNIYLAYDSVRLADNPNGASPQYSLQSTPPVTSQTVTNSFSPTAYKCVANYTIEGEIRQGSWNGATSDWTGYIFFGSAAKSFLSGGSNSSGQIYLQRRNTAHGYNSSVPVIIAGTNVGTLAQGEGKWFNIPSSVISAIANGNPVTLTGKGNSQYIKFESNSTIRLTTTKKV